MDELRADAVIYLDHIDGLPSPFGTYTENRPVRWKYIGHYGMDSGVHTDPIVLKGMSIRR
jgi:hypothetical protein